MLDKLHGARVFTKLDLASGYHQVWVHLDDCHRTVLIVPDGFYEYKVIPLGLVNAPPAFMRVMHKILHWERQNTIVYLDDVLIFSKMLAKQKAHVEICLLNAARVLQTQNVKANVFRTTHAMASAFQTRNVRAFAFWTQQVSCRCRMSRQISSGHRVSRHMSYRRCVPWHLPYGRGLSGYLLSGRRVSTQISSGRRVPRHLSSGQVSSPSGGSASYTRRVSKQMGSRRGL